MGVISLKLLESIYKWAFFLSWHDCMTAGPFPREVSTNTPSHWLLLGQERFPLSRVTARRRIVQSLPPTESFTGGGWKCISKNMLLSVLLMLLRNKNKMLFLGKFKILVHIPFKIIKKLLNCCISYKVILITFTNWTIRLTSLMKTILYKI